MSTVEKPWLTDSYHEYMHSEKWYEIRRVILARAGNRCTEYSWGSRCEMTKKLHVHHVTYDHLGNEWYEDLVVLCDVHHNVVHEHISSCNNGRCYNDIKSERISDMEAAVYSTLGAREAARTGSIRNLNMDAPLKVPQPKFGTPIPNGSGGFIIHGLGAALARCAA